MVNLRGLWTTEEEQRERERRKGEEDVEGGASEEVDPSPLLSSLLLPSRGSLSSLLPLSDRLFCAATGDGTVTMVEVGMEGAAETAGGVGSFGFGSSSAFLRRPTPALSVKQNANFSLRAVHTFEASSRSAASTALAVSLTGSAPLLAACSSDGSFRLIAPFSRRVLRTVNAHTSALQAAAFSSQTVLHTAGMGGNIAGWDTRALSGDNLSSSSPAKPCSLLVDSRAVSITALAMHPTRPFNLACGTSNGTISLFDLRSSSRPLCTIQSQRSYVSDVSFVSWHPSALIAASEDGSVCTFDFAPTAGGVGTGGASTSSTGMFASDVHFSGEEAASRMKPTKVYQHTAGINALAQERESKTILAGADGQAIIVIRNAM
jgi:WD40 repeat protein